MRCVRVTVLRTHAVLVQLTHVFGVQIIKVAVELYKSTVWSMDRVLHVLFLFPHLRCSG